MSHFSGGWRMRVALAAALKERGAPAIHVSTGGVSPKQAIKLGPGYQVPYAARIKAETGLATIAVGLITEAAQAEAILAEGRADAISLARVMLYDPRWPWHAAAELGAQVRALDGEAGVGKDADGQERVAGLAPRRGRVAEAAQADLTRRFLGRGAVEVGGDLVSPALPRAPSHVDIDGGQRRGRLDDQAAAARVQVGRPFAQCMDDFR